MLEHRFDGIVAICYANPDDTGTWAAFKWCWSGVAKDMASYRLNGRSYFLCTNEVSSPRH